MSEGNRERTALVTGGESGLGLAISDALWAVGYDVISYDKKHGVDVQRPMKTFLESGLDVLVNCAGIAAINWIKDVSKIEFDSVMGVNAWGMLAMTKAYLTELTQAKGTVLNIISTAAHVPMRASSAYNASKAAAHMLTLQMARELGDMNGITVFGVSPARIAGTNMSAMVDREVARVRGWTPEEVQQRQRAASPIGEEIPAKAVGDFIGWLLAEKDRHRFFHGCIIPYGA